MKHNYFMYYLLALFTLNTTETSLKNESTKFIFISNINNDIFCLIGGLFYLLLKNIWAQTLRLSFINAPKRPAITDRLTQKQTGGFRNQTLACMPSSLPVWTTNSTGFPSLIGLKGYQCQPRRKLPVPHDQPFRSDTCNEDQIDSVADQNNS